MSSLPRFSRLIRLAAALPTPSDYFNGRRAPGVVRADNLLAFFRADYASLQQRGPENHSHHRFVLLVPLGAAAGVNVDQTVHRLRPGEALLVFPFQFHFFVDPEAERLDWLVLTFESDSAESLRPLFNRIVTLGPDLPQRLADLLAAYRAGTAEGDADARLAAESLLQRLVNEALLRAGPGGSPSSRADSPGATGWLSHINRRLHDGAPGSRKIAVIADEIGVSERLLRHRFRESFGVSPGVYVRDFELNRAAGLLTRSDLPLGEVARRCGYASQAAFSRAFRLRTGLSPRDYRAARRA